MAVPDLTNPEERARAAYGLRVAAVPYHEIARQLGYANASGAWKAVKRHKQEHVDADTDGEDPVDDERALALERLDGMLSGLWPMARRGDVPSVTAVLRIEERRAKYLPLEIDAGAGAAPPTPGQEEDEVDAARRRRDERRARAAARRNTT